MSYTFDHGERFGSLTVLGMAEKKGDRPAKVRVGCSCGWRFSVRGTKLRKGYVKSCSKCAAKP